MVLQSAILGLGAYLTIRGELTAGAIIAASIATARALAPVEPPSPTGKASWRPATATRGWRKTLAALPKAARPLQLPPPVRSLAIEDITVPVPGTQRLILSNDQPRAEGRPGVGPDRAECRRQVDAGARDHRRVAAGARGGALDGAALDRWSVEELGRHIGYLPQDVALFDGTIAENIARFERARTAAPSSPQPRPPTCTK